MDYLYLAKELSGKSFIEQIHAASIILCSFFSLDHEVILSKVDNISNSILISVLLTLSLITFFSMNMEVERQL